MWDVTSQRANCAVFWHTRFKNEQLRIKKKKGKSWTVADFSVHRRRLEEREGVREREREREMFHNKAKLHHEIDKVSTKEKKTKPKQIHVVLHAGAD